ncbi:MAG TPA: FAD:protein FMN transferase [Verrucomicrobiales bacterium]|nr:FAD:protein FMN transferase [Verrucomicrobiales bacterium]
MASWAAVAAATALPALCHLGCGRAPVAVQAAAEEPDVRSVLFRHEFVEPHMGTRFRIVVYGDDRREAEAAVRKAFDRVADLEGSMSDYDSDSEIMRFCRAPAGEAVLLSEDLFAVLERAQGLSETTAGAFDVTVGNYSRHWRRAMRRAELPDPVALAEMGLSSGYEKLSLNRASRTGTLAAAGMRLDLGGIAKGYAADAALGALKANGFSSALVAASGDIAVGDPPPDREGWRVGVASIDAEDGQRADTLLLKRAAVSTSGDQWQFVEIDGVRYSHIIDPRTGLGLRDRIGVTVVAPDATTSDSYATAVSVLGAVRGVELIAQSPGLEALIVEMREDGFYRHETEGFRKFQAKAEGAALDFEAAREKPEEQ